MVFKVSFFINELSSSLNNHRMIGIEVITIMVVDCIESANSEDKKVLHILKKKKEQNYVTF